MYKQLISEQRYTVFILLKHGMNKKIAEAIKVSLSTISRELKCNSGMVNYSYQYITKVIHKINMRPREKLNFLTPSECFYEKYRKFALVS
jgi:IS30 family transposase